jgi:flagellar biosynthesis protein FliQ
VPKLAGVGFVIVVAGPLMMNKIVSFARDSFEEISQVLR